MNIQELEDYLRSHQVPIDSWGEGESKTLVHLLAELDAGESHLLEKDGSLLRIENGVAVNVLYEMEGQKLILHEVMQVFADGRPRKRDLSTSIGEKVKPGESLAAAAQRALDEELGIIGVALTNCRDEDRPPLPSRSFPGLMSKRTITIYDCYLNPDQYNPEGYIEHQLDKTTYFVWRPLT